MILDAREQGKKIHINTLFPGLFEKRQKYMTKLGLIIEF